MVLKSIGCFGNGDAVEQPASIISCLRYDLRKPARLRSMVYQYFTSSSYRMVAAYRLSKLFHDRRFLRRFSLLLLRNAERICGAQISLDSTIGPRLKLPHPNGVVIGEGVVIGQNVTIFQQVTLGAKQLGLGGNEDAYPVVGNHVVLYAGAKIIGNVTLGDYCQVGCNAVVLKDVEPYAVVAGIPAKVIGHVPQA